ncbi:MAG: triphosphoribosyl-dephospho-CoA synthase [Candidatus Helarchaeota archaeon]
MIGFSEFSKKIDKIDELVSASVIASLLEVSALKPGNVHPNHDIPDTRFEHFICANVVVYQYLKKIALGEPIGKNLIGAVRLTRAWQEGGNINFGILLLFAPILSAAGKLIREKGEISDLNVLRNEIEKIIENTTFIDSLDLYKAIEIIQPGGLGTIKELDVNDKNSLKRIKEDKLNLKYIFNQSASWDNISREWVTNYEITIDNGLPYLIKQYKKEKKIFKAITLLYLMLLGKYPDSLIIRKTSKEEATKISERAQKILSITNEAKQFEEIQKFDEYLHVFKGKYNPGTTADLVACTIFLAIIMGLRF